MFCFSAGASAKGRRNRPFNINTDIFYSVSSVATLEGSQNKHIELEMNIMAPLRTLHSRAKMQKSHRGRRTLLRKLTFS